jgi:hypothetical protein
MIGWANLALIDGQLQVDLGYAGRPPRSQAFQRALEAELTRFRRFLASRDSISSQNHERSGPAPV